jgi:3-deoxy-D-manno-octulosonic-acid transferase
MMRVLYTLLLYALAPRALAHLLLRSRRQAAYLQHIGERFGVYQLKGARKLIWVHAVSVGETRAAQPLIRALQSAYPDHRILLTHMTPTGRETGRALFGESVERCYLPYDFPWAVARFLDRFQPQAGIVMETEVWPNLIHACQARAIPLYLVNARLSGKSFRRYRRFSRLAAESLRELTAIAAQSADDAGRLSALGANDVKVTGNLKFDIEPDPEQLALGAKWRKAYGMWRPVVLAASTRDGEEALLLEALRSVDLPDLLFIIVPRHPQRFEEVAGLLERAGVPFQRRSADAPIAAYTRVLLGDSMGEMFAYLAACDVVLIGGSLLPFGAQNPIEACAVGRPFIIGPSIYNFTEATQLALAAGAAIQVRDAAEMLAKAVELLRDHARTTRMGEAALAFARSHRGATARVLGLIKFSPTTDKHR